MIISQYFIGFMISSILGWVWECFFCIVTSGKWENRGFLFGPYCPIYGISICIASYLFNHILHEPHKNNLILVFIICAIGSAIIEYITSYVLEKIYHARWWDYSHMPFNLNGRIALPVSISFGIAGVILFHTIFPFINRHISHAPSLFYELLALIFMLVLAMDIGVTLATLSSVVAILNSIESALGDKMQWAYDRLGEETSGFRDSINHYSAYIKNIFQSYASTLGKKEINTMHKMQYSKSEKSFIARKLENFTRKKKG